ncbi:MAG TPA: cytochrome c oxidase subunit 3 [Tepidisphaeraceae bacterium]|nr:cytochrome c oxidase subunit 3 [Tepidisphaeraceae bacterium]
MSQSTIFEPDTYPSEQFQEKRQQDEAATLGMWAFLATEILFFGALFASFYIYRLRWPESFADGATQLKWYLGTINTAVLLASSYCMALAVHHARHGDSKKLIRFLLLTILFGVMFLIIKGSEYVIEYKELLIPALNYSPISPDGQHRLPQVPLFMTFYFVMTAIHALHMLVGLTLLLILVFLARRQKFTAHYHNPVEIIGLYWHFVDMVWVFIYPTLYLLRHP